LFIVYCESLYGQSKTLEENKIKFQASVLDDIIANDQKIFDHCGGYFILLYHCCFFQHLPRSYSPLDGISE
jgi:hypothetical protein